MNLYLFSFTADLLYQYEVSYYMRSLDTVKTYEIYVYKATGIKLRISYVASSTDEISVYPFYEHESNLITKFIDP